MRLAVRPDVAEALAGGRPVVALETSIIAHGLPPPHNLRAGLGSEEAVARSGALPATVAVLEGALRVGLSRAEIEALASGDARKLSSRDLGPALASRQPGATTVAGTLRAAGLAGIRFMATGGIGGVHRGRPLDESADLFELTRAPVVVVCSGPKLVLDVALTMERLESLAVPVIAFRSDEMPAFYSSRSGLPAPARADSPAQLAVMLEAAWETGARGVVVAVPPPVELRGADGLVQQALDEVGELSGPELTPRLLARIADLSQGAALEVNLALVLRNAEVAGLTAAEFFTRAPSPGPPGR